MWHQWFNHNFTKLREYFVHKENKNTDFVPQIVVIPDGDASVTEIAHFSFNDQHCLVWWCEALTVRLLVGGGRTLAY